MESEWAGWWVGWFAVDGGCEAGRQAGGQADRQVGARQNEYDDAACARIVPLRTKRKPVVVDDAVYTLVILGIVVSSALIRNRRTVCTSILNLNALYI